MMQTIIQLLSGALGSIGFGLLFHLNRRYLPAAGVGGLLAWLAYLLAAIPAMGVTGIWWSVPIGWGLADLAGLLYYKAKKQALLL